MVACPGCASLSIHEGNTCRRKQHLRQAVTGVQLKGTLRSAKVRKATASQNDMVTYCCSHTVVQCTLSSSAWLQGDSGFMLVRERKVLYRSPVLQHFFDCPLQFGAVPDFSESTDSAEDAAVAELQVQPGDVLLAGSDGLWDNCYDTELLQLLPEHPDAAQQVSLQDLASIFSVNTRQAFPNSKYRTAFSGEKAAVNVQMSLNTVFATAQHLRCGTPGNLTLEVQHYCRASCLFPQECQALWSHSRPSSIYGGCNRQRGYGCAAIAAELRAFEPYNLLSIDGVCTGVIAG